MGFALRVAEVLRLAVLVVAEVRIAELVAEVQAAVRFALGGDDCG